MRLTTVKAIKTTGAVLLAGVMGTLGACEASAQTGVAPAASAPHGAATRQATPLAMPRYYVTVNAQGPDDTSVSVRNSGTGAVVAGTHVPGGPLGVSVTAAADDRTIVVGTSAPGDSPRAVYSLWRIHLSAAGVPSRPQRLTSAAIQLSVGLGKRTTVVGIALSPDGSKVAVSLERFAPSVDTFNPSGVLEVIDLASGKVRSWTSPAIGTWAGQPSWAGPSTVAFAWWRVTFSVFPRVAQHVAGIGSVSLGSGGSVLPGHLAPVPQAVGLRSVAFGGGATGLAIACVNERVGGGGRGVIMARFGQVGVTTGQFRILATQTASYRDAGTASALLARCGSVVSLDTSGQHALVYGTGFGRLDAARFTALAGLAADGTGSGAAW